MAETAAGAVPLVFTDTEGLSGLSEQRRDAFEPVLREHHRLIREAAGRWGGSEVASDGADALREEMGSMSTVTTTWTDEELMRVKHEGKVELVDGELILMPPAGLEQGEVDVNIVLLLGNYVKKKKLGKVYDAQSGFRPYDNMRAPDVSFVRMERLPGGKSPKGFGHFPPDLAVEVFAPKETVDDYADKLEEYFRWGVRLVWLVDPDHQTVTVCHSPSDMTTLTARKKLSGEDVVPGFSCRVAELFE